MTIDTGTHDFIIRVGAAFNESILWQDSGGSPIDLTGYSARMQVRETIDTDPPFLDLTSGAEITLGGVAGTINIDVLVAVTTVIVERYGVYDLELVPPSGEAIRLLEGAVTVIPEVTR